MAQIHEHLFLLNSLVVWSILITALVCYGLLLELCLFSGAANWLERAQFWSVGLRHMLAALPLLGLLGTIEGLLKTFIRMSVENGLGLQEVVSGGIAEAMFTTQLGLLMVIPGLLLLAFLEYKKKARIIEVAHEVNH